MKLSDPLLSSKRYAHILVLTFVTVLFILLTSCVSSQSQKYITVKVNVSFNASSLSFNRTLTEPYINQIDRIELRVYDSSNNEVFSATEADNKVNPTFSIQVQQPGMYKFVVEAKRQDGSLVFRGEKEQNIIAGQNNEVNIIANFAKGNIKTTIYIQEDILENYNVTSASLKIVKVHGNSTVKDASVTLTSKETIFIDELDPAMYTVTFTIVLNAKDEFTQPNTWNGSNSVSIQVDPGSISNVKFRIERDQVGLIKISAISSSIGLPYAVPVENISATWNKLNKTINLEWSYSNQEAVFYIFKEIETADSVYYEYAGSTTNRTYVINNIDQSEFDRISGIGINAVVQDKESGLKVVKKGNISTLGVFSSKSITYNIDTNTLECNLQTSSSGVSSYKVYLKKKDGNLENIGSFSSNNFSVQNFYAKSFWNAQQIGFSVVANGTESVIEYIEPESIQLTQLNVQSTSNTLYTLFIRSFYDSDGNGVGDFTGVAQKVNYLNTLGVDAVWFLPFNKAKSYHGYDVEDYYDVEPDYGTFEELEEMIETLNENGIRVVMDLVVNHTSDTHPWFLDAVENTTNSPYWNYYIMTLEDKTGQSHWHWKMNSRGQRVWYFGLFDMSMPDLNFSNPAVMEEVKKIIDFWYLVGVDGFRLDAPKHYMGWDWDDGITQSAQIASQIESYIRAKYGNDVILVGEVFDGNPSVLSQFAPLPVFNFTFMYGIRSNYEGQDNLLQNTTSWVNPNNYNLSSYHFPFIDNHDLDRWISVVIDQKYLGNVTNGTKQYLLTNAVLLSLKGIPTIYYGCEIGLRGWKWGIDPWDMPVREPMQWYTTQTGTGQTYWTKSVYQAKNITFGNANVDGAMYDDPNDGISVQEQENGYTILNFFREFINLRKTYQALSKGTITIERDWKNLIAIKRTYDSQEVLVLINLDPQYSNTFTVPAGYKWVWYAFFNDSNFEFGPKNESPLSQNTNWTVNPRQIYVFVKN